MEDVQLSRQTRCVACAAIPERLHAGRRHADRVRVVPVRLERAGRQEAPRRARGPARSPRTESCSRAGCTIVQDDPHRRLVASRACTNGIAGAMPDGGAATALVLTSLAIMGSPGPATISLTAAGSAFGVRRSLGYLAGIVVGTTVVLLAVASGITAALLALPAVRPRADRGLGGVHPLACVPRRDCRPAFGRDSLRSALIGRRHPARRRQPEGVGRDRGRLRGRPSRRPRARGRRREGRGADGDDRADQRGLARRRRIPRDRSSATRGARAS